MNQITVTIWHNVARDQAGRHTALLDGFTPGDPMVRVFTYEVNPGGRPPEAIAEDAFAALNGHPLDAGAAELSRRYFARRLRSVSRGDLVVVGEVALVCERAGWAPVRGGITEVRADEHGTHPLPAGSPACAGQRPAGRGGGETSPDDPRERPEPAAAPRRGPPHLPGRPDRRPAGQGKTPLDRKTGGNPGPRPGREGAPAMTGDKPEPAAETWTYAGVRAGRDGKRLHAWLDAGGEELLFSRSGTRMAVGSHYTVRVTRDGAITMHGTPAYAGSRADEATRRAAWARAHRRSDPAGDDPR